jgi:hypothetical protein
MHLRSDYLKKWRNQISNQNSNKDSKKNYYLKFFKGSFFINKEQVLKIKSKSNFFFQILIIILI